MSFCSPESWFRVRRTNEGQFVLDGLSQASFGYTIPLPGRDKPGGIFARWRWTGSALEAENDRYGFYPLFYATGDGWIAISPSVPKLVELTGVWELDDAALAVFLRLGFFLGESTPFRHIRAMPPDGCLRWRDGQLHVQGHRIIAPASRYSRDEIAGAYIDLFRQSIRRHPPTSDRFAMPLSGGRDSRHILLELLACGHKPQFCVTAEAFPAFRAQETWAAAQIAGATGTAHVVVRQPSSYVRAERERFYITRCLSDEHLLFLPVARYMQSRGIESSYDGIAGGIFSAGAFQERGQQEMIRAGRGHDFARAVMWPGPERILAPKWRTRFPQELAAEAIAAEAERYRDAPNPAANFYFWNRTRREIALSPYAVQSEIPCVYAPYLDPDLYDFLSSLPAEETLDHNLHTDVIARAYPQYANVPYAGSATPNYRAPWHLSRVMAESAWECVSRGGEFLDWKYLLPRLSYAAAKPSYAAQMFARIRSILYFVNLGVFLQGRSG